MQTGRQITTPHLLVVLNVLTVGSSTAERLGWMECKQSARNQVCNIDNVANDWPMHMTNNCPKVYHTGQCTSGGSSEAAGGLPHQRPALLVSYRGAPKSTIENNFSIKNSR